MQSKPFSSGLRNYRLQNTRFNDLKLFEDEVVSMIIIIEVN